MVKHYIIISSSYSNGTRIAYDIVGKNAVEKIKDIIYKITNTCGNDVPLSTHSINTDDESWDSVIRYDPFFKDIVAIDTIDKFIELINNDRTLKGLDVAKYVLSRIKKCTHLKLQKLVYLCYADYLCKTGNKLFTSEIYAFSYGPVIDDVYEACKKYGSLEIDNGDEITGSVNELPAQSRILFTKDGIIKLDSINKTLKNYSHLTATALVKLTHQEETPWSYTDSSIQYNVIIDEDILKYHCNEIMR